MSAFERTLKQHLVSYRIVYQGDYFVLKPPQSHLVCRYITGYSVIYRHVADF